MARRSDHTREQLTELALSSAEQLLNTKPASALSTRQIATKMGYTVGTLYQIFKNLPDLLLHVNARTLKRLYEDCLRLDIKHHSPEDNILAYANLYLEFAHKHQGLWTLIFDSDVLGNEPLPDWYLSQVNSLFSLIETELKHIKPESSEQEITRTSRVLWSSVHGICTLSINDNLFITSACNPKELISSLVSHYLKGWTHQ